MLRGDRQTQAAASFVTRRVRLVEPLEDPTEVARRHPRPGVGDRDHRRVALDLDRHLDRRARSVLAGVVEEVADDPLQPARLRVDDQWRRWQSQAGVGQPGRGDRPDEPSEIDRFGADALKFVNSEVGRHLRLRGIYAAVVQVCEVRVSDSIIKC